MNSVINFIKESIDEVSNKVTWPKFEELQKSTTLVLVASIIFALLIGLIDFAFRNGMAMFYQSVQ